MASQMYRLYFIVLFSTGFYPGEGELKTDTDEGIDLSDVKEQLNKCMNPLGMESGGISESQISASSSFDVKSVGPQNARIRQELNAGAWCPHPPIQHGVKEYLEIDFDAAVRITQTETQGRFGNGMGKEYAENYMLEYWRDSLSQWILYKDLFGRTILNGNKNTYIGVKRNIFPPVVASKLRFIPYSRHPRTICMRVEVYGCAYNEGIIRYECPQGYADDKAHPNRVDLRDLRYDGTNVDGYLRGGMGLLVDSLMPNSPELSIAPNKEFKVTGKWMGWTRDQSPIKIGFQFNQLRKFKYLAIHAAHYASQNIEIFASVDIYFSMDGEKFSDFPVRFTTKQSLANETAHLIQVPLKGRLATYIRLEFYHSNQWLLLSEILFNSVRFTGNVTDAILSLTYMQDGPDYTFDDDLGSNDSDGSPGLVMGLIVGSISVSVALASFSIVYYVLRRSHRNAKLVGVAGTGITPKSMSVGAGLTRSSNSDCEPAISKSHFGSHDDSIGISWIGSNSSSYDGTKCLDLSTKPYMSDILGTPRHSQREAKDDRTRKRAGKIALCDFKMGSPSRKMDSDDSAYHELVFGHSNNLNNSSRSSNSGQSYNISNSAAVSLKSFTAKPRKNFMDSISNSPTSCSSSRPDSNISHNNLLPTKPISSNILPPPCSQMGGTSGTKDFGHRTERGRKLNDILGMRAVQENVNSFDARLCQKSSPSTPTNWVRSSTKNGISKTNYQLNSISSHNILSPASSSTNKIFGPHTLKYSNQMGPFSESRGYSGASNVTCTSVYASPTITAKQFRDESARSCEADANERLNFQIQKPELSHPSYPNEPNTTMERYFPPRDNFYAATDIFPFESSQFQRF